MDLNFPVIFSDKQIEENNKKYILVNIKEDDLILDFSETKWIELSALITFTSQLISLRYKFKEIIFKFNNGINLIDEDISNAFRFLIESNIFMAITNATKAFGCKCYLEFNFQEVSIERFVNVYYSLKSDLALRIDGKLISSLILNEEKKSIRLYLNDFDRNYKFEVGFFNSVGFRHIKQRDKFIIPITYFSRNDLEKVIIKQNDEEDENYVVPDTLLVGSEILYLNKPYFETIQSLKKSWLNELILNAFQHGGNEILVCCRIGDWELRDRKIDREKIINQSYGYKYLVSPLNINTTNSFIDLYVADSGIGFITLKQSYENTPSALVLGKPKTLLPIHRFALFPHSSKKRLNCDEQITRITGLGILAQELNLTGGVLAIKDKQELNYFDSATVKNYIGNAGRGDHLSKNDFGITLISGIIPVDSRQTEWYKNIIPITNIVDNDNYTIIYYIHFERKEEIIISETTFEIKIDLENKYEIKQIAYDGLRLNQDESIVIIDLSDLNISFKKYDVSFLFREIKNIKKGHMFPVLFGLDNSGIRLIQNYFESEYSKTSLNLQIDFQQDSLFFPIINNLFEIFFVGNFQGIDVKTLYNVLINGQDVNPKLVDALADWGLINRKYLPISINRITKAINKLRGQLFLNLLSNDYLVREVVLDTHNNYLDSFYEVRSFLTHADNRRLIQPDINLIIHVHEPDVIIYDCPELKPLISESFKNRNLPLLGRFENEFLEIDRNEIRNKKSALFIITCAFEGSAFKHILNLITIHKIPIKRVVTLLDLTSISKQNIKSLIGCEYNLFAKGVQPKKIYGQNIKPKYFATNRARLVPYKYYEGKDEIIFREYINFKSLIDQLIYSDLIKVGHKIEFGHHYDIFIDVRKSINLGDKLSQHFRNLIQTRIHKEQPIIIYPEDSEIYPLLEYFKKGPGGRLIKLIPIRGISFGRFIWTNENDKFLLQNRQVIFIDEGIYSGTTLFNILDLIIESSPNQIEIVVLEKHVSYDFNYKKLSQFKNSSIPINLSCLFNLSIPSWNSDNCPYCKYSKEENTIYPKKFLHQIQLKQGEVLNFDLDLYYYLLSGIYESRAKSEGVLENISSSLAIIPDKYKIEIAKLLIIHNEILDFYNLYSETVSVIQIIIRTSKSQKRYDLLRHARIILLNRNVEFLRGILQEFILLLDDKLVYKEFEEIIESKSDWIYKIEHIIDNIVYPNKLIPFWNSLKTQKHNENLYDVVKNLLELFVLKKSDRHRSFGEELLNPNNHEATSRKIEILTNLITFFEPSPNNVIKKLKDKLNNPLELGHLIKSDVFADEFISEFLKPAKLVLAEIVDIVHPNKKIDFSKLHENGPDPISEPYLCIQLVHLNEIKQYLRDNLKYNQEPQGLLYEIANNELVIKCFSRSRKSSNEFDSLNLDFTSYGRVNHFIGPIGAKLLLDYTKLPVFVTVIYLKVVDYINIK